VVISRPQALAAPFDALQRDVRAAISKAETRLSTARHTETKTGSPDG